MVTITARRLHVHFIGSTLSLSAPKAATRLLLNILPLKHCFAHQLAVDDANGHLTPPTYLWANSDHPVFLYYFFANGLIHAIQYRAIFCPPYRNFSN